MPMDKLPLSCILLFCEKNNASSVGAECDVLNRLYKLTILRQVIYKRMKDRFNK
jgi:hypothetical protein